MLIYLFRRGFLFFLVILTLLLVLVGIYSHINREDFPLVYLRLGLALTGISAGVIVHANHRSEEYLTPLHERVWLLVFTIASFLLAAALAYFSQTTPYLGKSGTLLFAKIPLALAMAFGLYTFVRYREVADLPTHYIHRRKGASFWRNAREGCLSFIILLIACYCLYRILPDSTSFSLATTPISVQSKAPFPQVIKDFSEGAEAGMGDYNHPSIRENPAKRFQLCTEAAWYGDAVAQNDLGLMYLTAQGTSQNIEKGIYWLESAASQELPVAEFNLGSLYFHGRFVARDDAKAYDSFSRLAEKGFAQGHYFLGSLYLQGRGTARDPGKALAQFRQAAEKKHPGAEFRIGFFYLNGLVVERNIHEGLVLIERAAIGGYAPAQTALGMIFREGVIVLQNPIEAQKWFLLAAAQGAEEALHMSQVLRRELGEEEKRIAEALAARLTSNKR